MDILPQYNYYISCSEFIQCVHEHVGRTQLKLSLQSVHVVRIQLVHVQPVLEEGGRGGPLGNRPGSHHGFTVGGGREGGEGREGGGGGREGGRERGRGAVSGSIQKNRIMELIDARFSTFCYYKLNMLL